MPEKYQRPDWHERVQSVERMKRVADAEADALAAVREFNVRLSAGRAVWAWPTVAAALTAKCPWVIIMCDSCGMAGELDLRMKPREPQASVRVVLRDFRCPRCNGHGRPRIAGISGGRSA